MNNEPRVTSHEPRITNKAFTLIELVVAVALLAMVLAFASVIFKVGIEAYRTSSANAEIMQKLRAITDQLNRDFTGLQKDAPLFIRFQQDTTDPSRRYDHIMFFADGDFQSTQLYDGNPLPLVPAYTGVPVRGNVARISYTHTSRPAQPQTDRILARRQHILSADPRLVIWPDGTNNDTIKATFSEKNVEEVYINEIYEHDSLSLARWKTLDRYVYKDLFTLTLFVVSDLVNMGNPNTFHKLMCNGVSDFTIQLAYLDPDDYELRWFPSDDPDGNILTADSQFDIMDNVGDPIFHNQVDDMFGLFLGIPNCSRFGDWFPIEDVRYKSVPLPRNFTKDFYPKAIKFTFTLYDSKGILKEGRTFTHIVYVGD